ncbi:MAG TPA: hypothetical protein VNC50_04455, partial [Planctomycetia bacterium]|nr:hypothetical protein [Planctomycetia bacterium]
HFGRLQPGTWTPQVGIAAKLCDRLGENRRLEPEVMRGAGWLAQPKVVQYAGGLRESLHEVALQVGRADVVAETASEAWPGKDANALVDACLLAGWAGDSAELQRRLPDALAAIGASEPGPTWMSTVVHYQLLQACVRAGLLKEAAEICLAPGYPGQPPDELVIALYAAADRGRYARVRDRRVEAEIDQFRTATDNHHWASSAVRHVAETIRRLGDADGYRGAIEKFREVAAAWTPTRDWTACKVNCDLAVLFANAGEVASAAAHFDAAKRLFEGKEPGVPAARGGKSLMAAILSAAYRDVDETDLALRFAKKTSHSGDRRLHVVSALILGGRRESAEGELATLETPADRAGLIADSLMAEFTAGSSAAVLLIGPR